MTLLGTFGTDFGTFTLPKPTLILRGKWFPQTLYKKLDLVTYETSLYSCLKNHTSTLWEKDDSFWQEILSLPKPPSSSLPLYEKATLQEEGSLGKLALLLGQNDPTLIFFNGKKWQQLLKGDLQ